MPTFPDLHLLTSCLLALFYLLGSTSAEKEIEFSAYELHKRRAQCRRRTTSNLSRYSAANNCGDGVAGTAPAECANGIFQYANLPSHFFWIVPEFCGNPRSTQYSGRCLGSMFSSLSSNTQSSIIDYDEAINICEGATNVDPALCATSLVVPEHFPPSFRYDLCGAGGGRGGGTKESAECVNAITNLSPRGRLSANDTLALCEHAESNSGRASSCVSDDALRRLPSNLLAELCGGGDGGGAAATNDLRGTVECFERAPFESDERRVRLCSGSTSALPALCAGLLPDSVRRRTTDDDVVNLCRNAKCTAPARCVLRAVDGDASSLKHALRVCRNAESLDPASCLLESGSYLDEAADARIACEGATNATAVLSCLRETPSFLPDEGKARLCRGAKGNSTVPQRCAAVIWNACTENDPQRRGVASSHNCNAETAPSYEFCRNARDVSAALCVLNAPRRLSNEQKYRVCSNATLREATCDDEDGSRNDVIESCGSASRIHNNGSACDENDAMLDGQNGTKCSFPVLECVERGLEYATLDPELVVGLCTASNLVGDPQRTIARDRAPDGPVRCAVSVPVGVLATDDLVLELCANAVDTGPSSCLRDALRLGINTLRRVVLCRNAVEPPKDHRSSSPSSSPVVECAELVRHALVWEEILSLCRRRDPSGEGNEEADHRSRMLTPAYCALSLPRDVYEPWDLERCRWAVSVPTTLEIRSSSTQHENAVVGEASIVPGKRLRVLRADVVVRDQFGQIRSWDERTRVRAFVSSSHRTTTTIMSVAASEGVATFRDIVVPEEKETSLGLVVKFCIVRQPGLLDDQDGERQGKLCTSALLRSSPSFN